MVRTLFVLLFLCASANLSPAQAGDAAPAFADYASMRAHLTTLFGAARYAEAAAMLSAHLDRFPDHLEANAFNLAIVDILSGDHDAAVAALNRAADEGIWFGKYSIESEYFAPVFDLPAFKTFLARNNAMRESAAPGTMQYEVVFPENYDPSKRWPLFMAFHGGDGNIEEFSAAWHSPRLQREFVLAYVQSSVASNMKGFSWYIPGEIRSDILSAYHQIQAGCPIDPEQIYIGGFSAGATATFCMAFDSDLPVSGYICLGPPYPPQILTPENIKSSADKKMRGCFIVGENDRFFNDAASMAATLDSLGQAIDMIILPGVDHGYPEDLPARIDEALGRILLKN
ncbi:MAG: hypothetical protein KJ970_00140 [Candidatus Eisenbacteria bacterium]|uniref:Phospholipase/carboxylesterase/thioesterase domain-containing protein n=1 Tax=Eiseniibacteriota bacterium TaxID=2212470 RepID=A0A948RTJ9_UNCEI|nr:hypothetical protein [Candidatus Eisenbacteria bacterium]MBU1947096.1 hypothetical protein [Candidatus Eisenbacteria bacterium]MBU2689308.1 hypothetical protein [Candidatus Eisenbacteria bacterium]